jgi:threonyl-tRNA synthetase
MSTYRSCTRRIYSTTNTYTEEPTKHRPHREYRRIRELLCTHIVVAPCMSTYRSRTHRIYNTTNTYTEEPAKHRPHREYGRIRGLLCTHTVLAPCMSTYRSCTHRIYNTTNTYTEEPAKRRPTTALLNNLHREHVLIENTGRDRPELADVLLRTVREDSCWICAERILRSVFTIARSQDARLAQLIWDWDD